MRLLVATTNKKKLEELKAILKDLPLELSLLSDFQNIREVEETGETFQDNAILKASGYAKQTGLLTLAEDSGLCCDALEGAPGVFSARFSGLDKNDDANNQKLLSLLEKLPDNCRHAHYACAAALASPDKLIGVVQGEVHGAILRELRGSGGFGYDPLFFYPPFQKTFGEIPAEMKHKVSHRAQALAKLKDLLRDYLKR